MKQGAGEEVSQQGGRDHSREEGAMWELGPQSECVRALVPFPSGGRAALYHGGTALI